MRNPYPLLGPRFIGTRLNWQATPRRRQFEHVSIPVSVLASQRTYFGVKEELSVPFSLELARKMGGYLLASAFVTGTGDL